LTLIDKLNGTNDGRTIWFRNVPNIVATIRAAALLPTSTIKAQIDRIAERTRHQQELRERRHHQELRERRHQEELIARMIAEMFQKNDKGCCVQ
jgi:ribosomal protein L13